jgi:hypothetical protein
MHRKLKFRVWSTLGRRFEYFDIYEGANSGVPGVVQQFTGLTDKNGKDIYEGDTINFSCDYTVELGDKDIVNYANCPVYYDETFAGFFFGVSNHQILDKIVPNSLEVVGNIFEEKAL